MQMLPAVVTQREPVKAVNLTGKQAVLWRTETDEMVEKSFAQTNRFTSVGALAMVNQRLIHFFNPFNDETEFLRTFHRITRIKLHPRQRRFAHGIQPGFATGGEQHGHHPAINTDYGA